MPALVRPHDDAESLELALIENMAREDLNPVEEARRARCWSRSSGLTREDVGRRVGRSRVAVSNLCAARPARRVARAAGAGELSEGMAALLMAPDHGDRRSLARAAALEGWTVRRTEARARETGRQPGARGQHRRTAAAGVHPDQPRPRSGSATRSAGCSGRRPGPPARCRLHRDARLRSLDEALALAERLGAVEPA
jgi:ParB family chromosome partitioning protein